MARIDLERDLAALATMSQAHLRDRWKTLTNSPVPQISDGMLRMAVGYELQAKVLGGLSREARRVIDDRIAGRRRAPSVAPGTHIAREWNGTVHVVSVAEDGGIVWDGKRWRSLSVVARAITGTQWSGPAFFGLKTKAKAKAA